MSSLEKKEIKALEKISKELEKLESTCEKLNNANGKVKHFFEQEKAIHEIKKIIKECGYVNKLEDKDSSELIEDISKHEKSQNKDIKKIADSFNRLDKNLDKLDGIDENKLKSYVYQKKTLHDVKKILHEVGLYDKYSEKELEELKDLEQLND